MFRHAETTFEARRNRWGRRDAGRRPVRLLRSLFATLAVVLSAAAVPAAAQDAPLRVVTTVGMLADAAERVGGACVAVEALMGPGTDPHLYQARASDVARLQDAELILYVGLTLEGRLGDVLERFGRQTPTVAVAERAVPADRLLDDPDFEAGHDPHVWMSPRLWAAAADEVAAAIAERRPECAEQVRDGAAAFRTEALALHDWIAEAIATIPEERRVLVTAHDAFGYYGDAFGLDVVGIQGISTEAEPSIADIREVANLLAERRVPALFLETTVGDRAVRAVLDAARDRGHHARLGGTLYGDAMGEAGTAEGTWIGMLHANTVAIVGALGGTVPPLPEALADWADAHGADR